MYNLIVRGGAWEPDRESLMQGRMLEHTNDLIAATFKKGAEIDFEGLTKPPCLFMQQRVDDEVVLIGRITSIRSDARDIHFE